MRRLLAGLVVSVLVLAGAGIAVVSWEAADRLVHPPRDATSTTPDERGLAYEPLDLATRDGVALRGWWMPAANESPVVVFLHGYGASKAQSLSVAPFLHEAGYSVLAFDFRAHGESGGGHTTVGIDEVADVEAALSWLEDERGVDGSRVALFGWSMGAATAVNAARQLDVSGIVLDSPFAALDVVAARIFTGTTGLPEFPFAPLSVSFASWMVKRSVHDDKPVLQARGLATPILIIQGLSDPIVRPESDAQPLFAASLSAQLWLVPHAAHVDSVNEDPAQYEQRVLGFLANVLGDAS